MFSKINVLHIITKHVNTWIDDSTGNKSYGDFALFVVCPMLVASLLTFLCKITLSPDLINLFATTLSIVTALLFNLLILIFDISGKNEEKLKQKKTRLAEFLEQIYTNISFSIIVSILAVIIVIMASFNFWPIFVTTGLSFIAYALITLFLLTLFMILKRIDALLSIEFDRYKTHK